MANNQIAFILEGAHHLTYLPAVLKKNNRDYPVVGNFKNDQDLTQEARTLLSEGARVIISSGEYYETLVKEVSIPVVQITRRWADLTEVVRQARREKLKCAMLARNGVFLSACIQYKDKFRDDIRLEEFTNDDECHEKLQLLKDEGFELLICGSRGSNVAPSYGFKVLTVPFEQADILHAVQEAEHILDYIHEIDRRGRMLKTIQNSVSTAIIATDSDDHITEINNAAINMLGQTRDQLSGKNISDTVLSPIAALENYKTHSAASSEPVMINNRMISISLIPVAGTHPMTVITLTPAEKTDAVTARQKASSSIQKGHHAVYHFEDIIGDSPAVTAAINKAKKYAFVDSSILISAPTGCGKEMFAQSIHNSSRRRNMPFVVVNCAALPESLLESTLFGYEKGAYTGAAKEGRQGLFLIADGGTVFLDEISEMPLTLQSRFLRVLQEKEISPLGSERVIPVDVRVLAATNRNLYEMVEQGKFRQDLLFRLAVLELGIPSLEQRSQDIPLLVRHFLYTLSRKMALPCPEIDEEALRFLQSLRYPGNVRQLENLTERLLVLNEGNRPINEQLVREAAGSGSVSIQKTEASLPDLEQMNRERLLEALRQANGNRQAAAELLGISTATLWRHMKKYKLL